MTSNRTNVTRPWKNGAFAWRAALVISLATFAVVFAFALASEPARAQEPSPEARLTALDQDEAHKPVTQEARERARIAIEHSKRFRAAGDETHAKLSDRVAIAWLAAAEDLVRTADAEGKAAEARRGALDAGSESERERALLEETMLQNGRLRAEVDEAERDAKAPREAGAPLPLPKIPAAPKATSLPAPKARVDGGAR